MENWKAVAENISRPHGKIYYLNAKIAGKKIRRSLKTDSLKVAKMKRDDLLLKLRAKSGHIPEYGKMTLCELIELTRSHYAEIPSYKIKPASMQYRNECLASIESVLPNRAIATISEKETADAFKEIARKYSAQRYNNILGTFRKMMQIAVKAHARIDDPSTSLKRIPVRKSEIVVPTVQEFKEIVKSVRSQKRLNSHEVADMIEFLAYSGMRIDEARCVTGFDVGQDQIKVTGGNSGTKNHEIRYVPIVPAMRDLLNRMKPGPEKQLFRIKSPRGALKNACLRLDLKHVRVHDLRHFFATTCIESGIDFATIAKWLGHKDGGILVAKTYGHIRDEHSQREAAKVVF